MAGNGNFTWTKGVVFEGTLEQNRPREGILTENGISYKVKYDKNCKRVWDTPRPEPETKEPLDADASNTEARACNSAAPATVAVASINDVAAQAAVADSAGSVPVDQPTSAAALSASSLSAATGFRNAPIGQQQKPADRIGLLGLERLPVIVQPAASADRSASPTAVSMLSNLTPVTYGGCGVACGGGAALTATALATSDSRTVGGKRSLSPSVTASPPPAKSLCTGLAHAGDAGAEVISFAHKNAAPQCRKAQRPAMNLENIRAHVDTLYRWDWRNAQGEYISFSTEHNIQIETSFRGHIWGARLKLSLQHFGLVLNGCKAGKAEEFTFVIDFHDMTVGAVGLEWSSVVRRWNRDTPMAERWDHQDSNVRVVNVDPHSSDYQMVVQKLLDMPRADGIAASLSRRSHEVVTIQRIQNRGQLRLFDAIGQQLGEMRGDSEVAATVSAWHGSATTPPLKIAQGKSGLATPYGAGQGYYKQGCYTAEHASFCHHARYVYRSSDVEGVLYDPNGRFHHLLLVKVQRGNFLRDAAHWQNKGDSRDSLLQRLGENFDSVEGGPHRPTAAGPGADDSKLYVVHQQGQCLPSFIVTYQQLSPPNL